MPPAVEMAQRRLVVYTMSAVATTARGIRVNKKSRTRLLIATGVIVVVFVIGVVFLVQRQGAYYRQVSDLTTGQYDGKNLKIGGRVQAGSIARDADGVHFTMVDLTGKPDAVKVTYDGQMPNTFGEGVDVVVIGTYAAADGLITADELQTKCPSKYQGQASPSAQPGQ
jgi:cytochrome c-type biogenesis protein CcmE